MFRKLLFKLLTMSVVASMDGGSIAVTYGGIDIFRGKANNIRISRDIRLGNKGRIEIDFNEDYAEFISHRRDG